MVYSLQEQLDVVPAPACWRGQGPFDSSIIYLISAGFINRPPQSAPLRHLLLQDWSVAVVERAADESKQAGDFMVVQDAGEGRHAVFGEALQNLVNQRVSVANERVVSETRTDATLGFVAVARDAVQAVDVLAVRHQLSEDLFIQFSSDLINGLGDRCTCE